jgi:hypothetical protein
MQQGGSRWLVGLLLLVSGGGCGRSDLAGAGSAAGDTTAGSWSSGGPGWTTTTGASTTDDSAGDDSGPEPQPDVGVKAGCEGLGELKITDVAVEPVTPPQWNPGEKLRIDVTVTNTGNDYTGYFGVLMTQGVNGIASKSAFQGSGNWIPAGGEQVQDMGLRAEEGVEPGILVKITIEIALLDTQHGGFQNCPNTHVVQFEWPLE